MRSPHRNIYAAASLYVLVIIIVITNNTVFASSGVIKGQRAPCSNEGEPVGLQDARLEQDWSSCFRCICKNGFVECRSGVEECGQMDDCAVVMPRSREGCCARCKGCWYNGTEYASHSEWNQEGKVLRCEAGVITISRPECYSPCDRPKHQRHTHYNCPVCDDCVINGQRVYEGHDVRIPEEPCLSCRCVHGSLSCAKRACPVLPCVRSQQYTPAGECCPRCSHPTSNKIFPVSGNTIRKPCVFGQEYYEHLNPFRVDPCTDCTCLNGTSVCTRHTCPVLTCGARALPPAPGKCCPECPQIEQAKAACIIGRKTYQDGETWQLDACKSCECHGGEPRCAMERCPVMSCPPDQMLRLLPGQCCPKCIDTEGICTVFGDPHYKTFDGKFYSFQGSCKYQLVSDCVNNTFSIRVSNDARNTSHSSWTRTATLHIGTTKINMGKRMRIKVNGHRVFLPYKINGVAEIIRSNGSVLLKSEIGVQMLWDGDGFLEVTVSSVYKGKLCGLCGNFNSVARDDLKAKDGKLVNDTWRFGSSWRVGGPKSCTRQKRHRINTPLRLSKLSKARRLCRGFVRYEAFTECGTKVNPHHYQEACELDARSCSGTRCHCAAYRAYARECTRLGVEPKRWMRTAWCEGPPPPWLSRSRKGQSRNAKDKDSNLMDLNAIPKPSKPNRARPPPPILH